jgi:hypothetical protein
MQDLALEPCLYGSRWLSGGIRGVVIVIIALLVVTYIYI